MKLPPPRQQRDGAASSNSTGHKAGGGFDVDGPQRSVPSGAELSTRRTDEQAVGGVVCEEGCGYSGDDGPATEAMLDTPSDVAVAQDGSVYIADTENSCVRVIDPDGTIRTFAGICGERGYAGDSGPADEALLHRPFGVAVDMDGKVYISDTYNSAIRVVEPE